jgi:hypothetical protein
MLGARRLMLGARASRPQLSAKREQVSYILAFGEDVQVGRLRSQHCVDL